MIAPQFNFFLRISQSSILNSIFVASLFILFLWQILNKEKNYKYFRSDFISIIVVLVVCRLILPIECFYTWTLPSKPYGDLHHYVLMAPVLNTGLEIKDVFILICIVGSIIQLIRYGYEIYQTRFMDKYVLVSKEEQMKVDPILTDFTVVKSEYIKQPEVRSFKRMIYLPKVDFSELELKYILLHETRHLKNHDLLLLQIVNVLQIIYWWFPLIYVFRREFQFLLEIRVDHQVSKILNQDEYLDYAQAMIGVNKKIEMQKVKYSQNLGFANFEKSELSHRVVFYLEGENRKRTSKLLLALLLIFGIGSSAFILEPYYGERIFGEDYVGSSNSYLIEKKDGTFEWYSNGKLYDVLDQEAQIQAVKEGKLDPIPIRKE